MGQYGTLRAMNKHPMMQALSDRGITAAEYERSRGLYPGTVSRWCGGRRLPRPHFMQMIEQDLGVTAQQFHASLPATRKARARFESAQRTCPRAS